MPRDDHPDDRPRPRKRPQQARSRITVEAVVEAAAQVLVTDGYDGLTTTRVAERAGVSVGTLYQYFPDKDGLVAALVESHLAAEEAALTAAFADFEEAGGLAAVPLPEAVDRLVGAFVGVFAESPERSSALYAQVPYVKWQGGVLGVARRTTEAVTALLQAHAPDVRRPDPALAAFVVVHAVDTLTQRAVAERPADVASGAVTAEAVDLVRRYLLLDG
jgi:AcrR family transcriptional regulator